jgi:hypothetical protein
MLSHTGREKLAKKIAKRDLALATIIRAMEVNAELGLTKPADVALHILRMLEDNFRLTVRDEANIANAIAFYTRADR